MSIQQSLNAALTTSAALYTQSAGYKERQIQKLGKFAEAKEEEFSKKFSEISPKIVKAKANLEKSKQKQEELKENLKNLENYDKDQWEFERISKMNKRGGTGNLYMPSPEDYLALKKRKAAANIKRAQTAYAKAQNELEELNFKRNLYRNLYGGAR